APFARATTADVIAAILEREPAPLTNYSPEVPRELERIVSKALEKDREERYQVVKDLLIDLKKLKRHLEFEAELERSVSPDARYLAAAAQTAQAEAARTGEGAAVPTTSSAKILLGEIKRHRLGVSLTVAVLVLVA